MGTWSSWEKIGTIPGKSAPVAACNKDGRLEAVTIDTNGAVWRSCENAPGGDWSSSWISLTPNHHKVSGIQYGPVVVANGDGRLEVFIFENGKVRHIWQKRPNGGLPYDWGHFDEEVLADAIDVYSQQFNTPRVLFSNWPSFNFPLGNLGIESGWSDWEDFDVISATGTPVVGRDSTGQLQLFVPASQGPVFTHQIETIFPDEWIRRIHWTPSWKNTSVLRDGAMFLLQKSDGTLEILGGWDGQQLYQTIQRNSNGTIDWDTGMIRQVIVSDHALGGIYEIVPNGIGGLDVFVSQTLKFATSYDVSQRSLVPAADGFWTCDIKQPLVKVCNASGKVKIVRDRNGCLELFAVTTGQLKMKTLIHKRQTTAGGSWIVDTALTNLSSMVKDIDFNLARTGDGRLAIFARFGGDDLYYCVQAAWDQEY